MAMNEKTIEFLEEHIPELGQAYWQALASGSSVLISDNGVIKEVFPDGTIQVIEKNEPFIRVKKGKITIR
jgi:hypothetical protein